MRHPGHIPPHNLPAGGLQTVHIIPYGATTAPARSCDDLGLCQHTDLDCGHLCQREALDAGMVDVPLPGLPAGNFWLEPPAHAATPFTPQLPDVVPPLLNVTMQPSWRDTAWYWFWVAMAYVLFFIAAGYLWGKLGGGTP